VDRIRSINSEGITTAVIINKLGIADTKIGHTMVKNKRTYMLTDVVYCVTPRVPLYTEQRWQLIDYTGGLASGRP
jgi:hypothetical protein